MRQQRQQELQDHLIKVIVGSFTLLEKLVGVHKQTLNSLNLNSAE